MVDGDDDLVYRWKVITHSSSGAEAIGDKFRLIGSFVTKTGK